MILNTETDVFIFRGYIYFLYACGSSSNHVDEWDYIDCRELLWITVYHSTYCSLQLVSSASLLLGLPTS